MKHCLWLLALLILNDLALPLRHSSTDFPLHKGEVAGVASEVCRFLRRLISVGSRMGLRLHGPEAGCRACFRQVLVTEHNG